MSKKKPFDFIAAGCLLVGLLIPLLVPVFSLTPSGEAETATYFLTMPQAKVGWAQIIVIILDVVGIIALFLLAFEVFPTHEAILYKIAIGAAVLSMLTLLISVFISKTSIDDVSAYREIYGTLVHVHLRFIGWLTIALHLCSAVFSTLSSRELF